MDGCKSGQKVSTANENMGFIKQRRLHVFIAIENKTPAISHRINKDWNYEEELFNVLACCSDKNLHHYILNLEYARA